MKDFGEKEVKIQLRESTGPQGIPGPAGPRGEEGRAGFSPIITVTRIDGGHRVKITDASGTRHFDVMDGAASGDSGGAAGKDGFSPVIQVTTMADGHRVVVTDAGGTRSFDVKNGEDGSDGRTPVRGEDYWTSEDRAQMVCDVLAALPNASGVEF